MKGRITLNALLALGLILALGAGSSLAQEATVSESESIDAVVSTAFTYQGRLTKDGSPVVGPCDFEFSLWTQGLAGSQIGIPVPKDNVALSNGYFTVALDFGPTAFPGDARFLQIAVRCPAASGSWAPLSGRVELTATPYALNLRPGANVSGSIAPGYILKVENTGTGMLTGDGLHGVSTNSIGVYGESLSSAGTGVKGKAASTGKGVQGETFSGYGVYGEATGASGTTYGVYGKTNSAAGHGVYGTSPSTNPLVAGVTGVNTGSGVGSGVYGYSNAGYGVYGRSAANKAIYSDGDAHVEGNLTWKAKKGYVSVSAAAFEPSSHNYMYTNWGNVLYPANMTSRYYYAPVQLPHGATVTKLTFYWSDVSGDYKGQCWLYRSNMTGGGVTLATVETTGQSGAGVSSTTTIDYETISNAGYAYYIGWDLQGSGDVQGYGVVIEYFFFEPY